MELAEAAHSSPTPHGCGGAYLGSVGRRDVSSAAEEPAEHAEPGDEVRAAAVRAFASQWLHFLHTAFLPRFAARARGRHRVSAICFSGGVIDFNQRLLYSALVDDAPGRAPTLRACTGLFGSSASHAVSVLPPAPVSAGLVGAMVYALAGMGGAHMQIWAA